MKVKDIYYLDAVAFGDDYLAHHGIKGQRWGVRRYQNEDGTYTAVGKKRRVRIESKYDKELNRSKEFYKKTLGLRDVHRTKKVERYNRAIDSYGPIKNGYKNKRGKEILSKKDIADITKAFTSNRDRYTKDFDEGTRLLKKGQSRYNKTIRDYKNARIKAIGNKKYKKTAQYKNAKRAYAKQRFYKDALYGRAGTALVYASDSAKKRR